jgi:hypothetical protein
MDTVTYPDAAVAEYVDAHFVGVKLNLAEQAEAAQARELVPLWTPTLIVADGRGREVHREIGWLPPQDLLPALKIARAKGLFATGRGEEAVAELDAAVAQHSEGEYAPQLLYWRGALGYSATHDREHMVEYWGRLRERFPESTWTTRCSFPRD